MAQELASAYFVMDRESKPKPVSSEGAKDLRIIQLLGEISKKRNIKDLSQERNVTKILAALDLDPKELNRTL